MNKEKFKLVRCRSCGTLQTFNLWSGKTEKRRGFNKLNCCCNCGKKKYTIVLE